MQIKLTQHYVQSVKPVERRIKIRDIILQGLVLFVDPSGKKTWYIDYKRPNGKRTDYKIGAMELFTVAEARDVAQKFLASVRLGEDPLKKKKQVDTFRQLVEDNYAPWVLTIRKSGSYSLQILRREFSFLYDLPLAEISVIQIERWRTARKQSGVKGATINRQLAVLKAVLNWSVQSEIIGVNPISKIKMLHENDSNKKIRYLSSEEHERLYAALDAREERLRQERDSHNLFLQERQRETMPSLRDVPFADYLKPIIITALNTGIRQGSLFQLLWSDINFPEGILTVRPSTEKNSKLIHIPMNETLTKTLLLWKEQTGRDGDELVFPSPVIGLVMDNCKKAWAGLLKAAKIENFRWHDMRHDFASQLVMKGVDLNTVRELLGHTDLKMTLRYAHLAPQVKRAAVEMLD